jgi:1-acyl-sn-glycerol-3-phosphate acyltransferase
MPRSHIKNFMYRSFTGLIRGYSRTALDLQILNQARVPEGPKIYVSNHLTSFDPYWLMAALPEFLHFVVGPPMLIPGMSKTLKAFEQINALPAHRKNVVDAACHYLALGEAVCIYPEGDVQPPFQLGHFYTGLAKIYRQSGAPIVPIALAASPDRICRHPNWDIMMEGRTYEARMMWRGKVRVAIGEPLRPALNYDTDDENDNRRITEEIRDRIGNMLRELALGFAEPQRQARVGWLKII